MSELFNENMTSYEARSVFFSAIENKSKEEIEKIREEYFQISGMIIDRELSLAQQGWLIG